MHLELTFWEKKIYVPLPAPDAEFQNEIPTVTGYLNSDSLTVGAPDSLFIDFIHLAAICGRAVSHRHQSIIDKALGVHNTAGIWQRHREINAQLAENLNLANSRQHLHHESESLGPFMGIMWRTVILHLHSTLSCTASTGKEEYDYAIVESMQRGTLAAQEALSCMERLSQCNSLKVRNAPPPLFSHRASERRANLATPTASPHYYCTSGTLLRADGGVARSRGAV